MLELVPKWSEIVILFLCLVEFLDQALTLILGLPHLKPQRALLVLQRREGVLAHLELLLQVVQRCLVILKLDSHLPLAAFPVFVNKGLLDSCLSLAEIFTEQFPSGVEHLGDRDVDIY